MLNAPEVILKSIPDPAESSGVAVTLQSSYLGLFAHAGFMNALLDRGIRPAKVSGSSSGAIIAAAFACGLEGDALKAFALAPQFQRSFIEWRALLRGVAVFAFYRRQGVVRGHRAVKYLREVLPSSRIEEARHAELSIGVTNFTQKKRQLVTHGDLAEFVLASCAVPPLICAQEIEGELYLDGGFTDESPFEQWIDDPEIHTVIIHQVTIEKSEVKPVSKRSNFIECWGAMHTATADELLRLRMDRLQAAGKRVIIHETVTSRPHIMATSRQAHRDYQIAYDTFNKTPSDCCGRGGGE